MVTSSGTDTYSSIAASIGSLKGPRHGGANLKVQNMFEDIKANVKDWTDEKEVEVYLCKILNKEAFDHTGLIYGMGHAVYTLSDPREVILKRFARDLAQEKGMMKEFALYELVERLAGRMVMEQRRLFKNVCANVDFTVVSYILCLESPKSCLHQFSQLHVFRDGAHIVLRKSSMRARLSVRHINMWDIMQTSFRLKKESRRKAAKKYCGISKGIPEQPEEQAETIEKEAPQDSTECLRRRNK